MSNITSLVYNISLNPKSSARPAEFEEMLRPHPGKRVEQIHLSLSLGRVLTATKDSGGAN